MDVIEEPKRFGHHRNAFGFLRLTFASLVIASHTPELVDGSRTRELLTRCFGTISFGDLAVDGFFIISGLLISASFLSSKTVWDYLVKRVARIYPAFVIASLVCVLVVASIGGASEGSLLTRAIHTAARSLFLTKPYHYGAFAGSHYQDLDGSMWTIPYEFRCYLLVIVLGAAGVLENAAALTLLAFGSLIAATLLPLDSGGWLNVHLHLHADAWLGDPIKAARLTGMFLAGAAFRLIQHRIPLRPAFMAVSGAALAASLFSALTVDIGIAIFGSYLIFGAAALGRGTFLEKINNKNDVSYGLYLYAYPIEKLLISFGFGGSLLLVGLLTWLGAVVLGCVSWFAIERPIMRLVRSPAHHRGPSEQRQRHTETSVQSPAANSGRTS